MPRRFRDTLHPGCVITKGHERCLYVYTEERWSKEVETVTNVPASRGKARGYSRSLFASASDAGLDKQGRIGVPEALRKYASLDKDVTVVGVGDHVEIWSTPVWEQVSAAADELYADIDEALSAGGEI